MAYKIDPITLATEGYQRSSGPDEIAIATHGYVHIDTGVPPSVRNATHRMWVGGIGIDVYGRYDRG